MAENRDAGIPSEDIGEGELRKASRANEVDHLIPGRGKLETIGLAAKAGNVPTSSNRALGQP